MVFQSEAKRVMNALISKSRRLRSTPFSQRVEAAGVKAYSVYNHMLLPAVFESLEADYWHLCEHVQVWDVAAERQVELKGPDAARLAQLMTPRDLTKLDLLQGMYAPICNAQGFILNDPIIIKIARDRFWISVADSDIKLFAQGLAIGMSLDVEICEPNVSPLAVQGPKAEQLMVRVFGERIPKIRFFRGLMLEFKGQEMYVARSGWSKQGGFEIYLNDPALGPVLWDELFAQGKDLHVRAGCPNNIERLESGLLSYGNDMDEFDTPFECGLDSYLDLGADIDSLSIEALRQKQNKVSRKLVGLAFHSAPNLGSENVTGGYDVFHQGRYIGELRSQAWSPRYNKQLALAMLELNFLEQNNVLEVAGQKSLFHSIPFNFDELT